MRILKLFEAINQEIESARIKRVQVLMGSLNGHLTMKFICVDTHQCKEKVKTICDRYCESLELVKETKTTLVYLI